jgi:hypothetical protein
MAEGMTSTSPYFNYKLPDGRWLVPRDPIENMKWRIRCRERALVDRRFRDALWQACMDDVLFFCAFALWVDEPRALVKRKPMIPWPHQIPVILAMDETITEAMATEQPVSLTLKKSRAQGGTYVYLAVTIRRALKESGFTVGLVTRNEQLVDSRIDDTAVMFKVARMLDLLPVWMLPKGYERNMTEHVIRLPNGSGWSGYAATSDVARGGRTTVFCFDEPGSEEFVAANRDFKILSSVAHVSNCAAEGTLVVTDRGLVPIEEVTLLDRVWDGNMWVSQDGCLYRGQQKTIRSYRVGLTPDHLVLTTKGWRYASEGLDREEVWLPDGYLKRYASGSSDRRECVLAGEMRLRNSGVSTGNVVDGRKGERLQCVQGRGDFQGVDSARNEPYIDASVVGEHDPAMREPELCCISTVRRSRNHGLREVDGVRQLLGGHGHQANGTTARKNRQQQGVLSRELPLGDDQGASEQPEKQSTDRDVERDAVDQPDCRDCGCELWCDLASHQKGPCRGCAPDSIQVCDVLNVAVYDLLNCGPRRAFTVLDDDGRPLLIHNCIFLCSTFGVDSGVFYEAATDPDNPRVYSLSWRDNPDHARLAYTVNDGVAKALKPEDQEAVQEYIASHKRELKSIERRGHKTEGVVQSPWYNAHRLQPGATPRFIARELDMDPRGAVGKCFPADLLDRMKREHCKPPVWQGQPVFDFETLQLTGLITRDDGPLKLWFKPGIDNSPPLGPFTIGCDIALGGSSAWATNSVASALDNRTGEQSLEYTVKGMEPIRFADMAIGLAKWLRNALLGWEDSGMSGGFAKQIMEVRYYGNVFFRDVMQLGSQKKSRKPGWPCRDNDKAEMFEKLALAMETGKYVPRSEAMIVECGEYEWDGGKIVHAPTKNKGATEKNHGDRCIAGGGCWLVFSTDNVVNRLDSDEENGQIPEYGSFKWRENRERRGSKSGSPGFGILDLIGGR